MRILALIAARGGSKRLPGKNTKMLGGKPLITWSIEITRGVADICDTLVSTDDSGIADVARTAGALVPWLRPPALATDTAGSVDVALHALDWYEREAGMVDGLLLLQPTSPFRTRQTVRKGIELFAAHHRQPVLAISPAKTHPKWVLKCHGDSLEPYLKEDGLTTRSQDLEPVYEVNGSLYLISPETLRSTRSFAPNGAVPLLVESPSEAIDIDTEWDWAVAETALATRTVECKS